MEFKDYYKILEVEKSATQDEIKKAYKRLARRYHPDVSKEDNAEQKFKNLGEAYEVLKDPDKRLEYDQLSTMGARGGNGQFTPPPGWESATHYYDSGSGDGQFSDFFEAMFGRNGGFSHQGGRGQGVRMRGEDVHAELALLLEEACQGCEQVVAVRVQEVDAQGLMSHRIKKLKVKVPAGSGNGTVLRIAGQGAPGLGGAPSGDLLITLKLAPHPLFSVDDKQVSLIVPVMPWEAASGCVVTIPTLKGRSRVTVPAGSQNGQKLRLTGQGMPGTPPGDFFVVLKIVMPEQITDKEKDLFTQLEQSWRERKGSNPRAAWETPA